MYVISVISYDYFNVNEPKFIHIHLANVEVIDHWAEDAITKYRQA